MTLRDRQRARRHRRRRHQDYALAAAGTATGYLGTALYQGAFGTQHPGGGMPRAPPIYSRPAGPTYEGKYKYRPRKIYKEQKKLENKVSQLKKVVDSTTSSHTWKKTVYERFYGVDGEAAYDEGLAFNHSTIANAIGNLRFFNPSVPGTLITADADAGLYSREMLIPSIYNKIEIRNNHAVPCYFSVYLLSPKTSTNTSPDTYRTNGLTDQGAPDPDSTMLYPSDSQEFVDQWRIVKSKKVLLKPGKQLIMSHVTKDVKYNPALEDTNNLTYEKGTLVWYYRMEGVIGYSAATNTNIGRIRAGVDLCTHTIIKIKYDSGGVPLNDITLVDGISAAADIQVGTISQSTTQEMISN